MFKIGPDLTVDGGVGVLKINPLFSSVSGDVQKGVLNAA